MRPTHPCLVCGHATQAECSTAHDSSPHHRWAQCPTCGCLCTESRGGAARGVDVVTSRERTGPQPPEPIRHI